ncbi:ribosomal RNA small subunit methyltransferase E [Acrasis kona]|uniref:16S rRNA (uracil(1498)-N(3))-methyltransferase n=1 Tax=Acrasis kona TaxID=1008807 RepID=A0AAW2YL66_9EUKA
MSKVVDNKHIFSFRSSGLKSFLINGSTSNKIDPNGDDIEIGLDKTLTNRLITVLRMKSGSVIELFDDEVRCTAVINIINRQLFVAISPKTIRNIDPLMPEVNLHFGLLKTRESNESVLESCTLFGVCNIFPILSDKSQGEWNTKKDRYMNVLTAAMEQSKQYKMPSIHEPKTFNDWSRSFKHTATSTNMFCDFDEQSIPISQVPIHPQNQINILVGPEGDFTNREKHKILSLGFNRTMLSSISVLRSTEAIKLALGFVRCVR